MFMERGAQRCCSPGVTGQLVSSVHVQHQVNAGSWAGYKVAAVQGLQVPIKKTTYASGAIG